MISYNYLSSVEEQHIARNTLVRLYDLLSEHRESLICLKLVSNKSLQSVLDIILACYSNIELFTDKEKLLSIYKKNELDTKGKPVPKIMIIEEQD